MIVPVRALLLILGVICSAPPVVAQLPFYTDNPQVADLGTLHFEFSNEFDRLQSSQYPDLRQNTANFRVNYGLPHRLELDFDVPYLAIDRAPGKHSSDGIGDTDMGVKWNFRAPASDSRAMVLGASLYIEFPTGSVRQQLGSGLSDVWLNFIAQKPFTPATRINANVGFLFAGNTSTGVIGISTMRGNVLTGGISLLHDFTPRLTLGGEVYGAVADTSGLGREQLQGMLGAEYSLSKRLMLTFGVLGGKYEASPKIGGQIGFTLDFPAAFHSASMETLPSDMGARTVSAVPH